MTNRIVIVGSEEKYWNKALKEKAKNLIVSILLYYTRDDSIYVASGECPYGGVDIWAKDIAEVYPRVIYIAFPPESNDFRGYMKRNKQLAVYGDIIFDIEPSTREKQSSGAEWVLKYARDIGGKELYKIVIY